MDRPIPGDDSFWKYAKGDPPFAEWINRVDELCMRFLGQDLLSMVIIVTEPGLDLRECYDSELMPGAYFAELVDNMKAESGDDVITSHIAHMAKWGDVLYGMD